MPSQTQHSQSGAKIFVAGNCQVLPFSIWLKQSLPSAEVVVLPQYHHISSQLEIDQWVQGAKSADYIFMINVSSGYRGFDFGVAEVELKTGIRPILYPNFYCSAFFPFMGTWKDVYDSPFYGPYHDYLAAIVSTLSPAEAEVILGKITGDASVNDSKTIMSNSMHSFEELTRRYPEVDPLLRSSPSYLRGSTFNHPSAEFLNAVYSRIWTEELRQDEHCFAPLSESFMTPEVLPVPQFVVESVRRSGIWSEAAWNSLVIPDVISNAEYVYKLSKSIAYYREIEFSCRSVPHHSEAMNAAVLFVNECLAK